MSAATVSGLTIRTQLFERSWMFPGAEVGAGAANYILDTTRLEGNALPSGLFDGAIVRITSGDRAGERSYVDYLDQDTGKLYLTPSLTGALADADTYEVWLKGIDPDMADRLRDEALRKTCSVWRVQTLCLIPDGDMDAADTTHWAVAGSATRTKGFGVFPEVHGRRQLSVIHTTAATDYVKSDTLSCQPGERWFFECPVSAYVTTGNAPAKATVVVQDLTNSAAIPLGGIRTSHTGYGWGGISLLFTIPAGCYKIEFRLTSDTDASTTVWGPMVCFRRTKWRVSLPDRITSPKRVGTTFRTNSLNPAASEVNDSHYKLREYANVERKRIGSQVELWFNPPLENIPVYYHERGYFDALQTSYYTAADRSGGDAAVTDCPRDYVVAATAEAVAKYMLAKNPTDPQWQAEWIRASADLNYWEGEFGPEPQYIESDEEPVFIPYIRV